MKKKRIIFVLVIVLLIVILVVLFYFKISFTGNFIFSPKPVYSNIDQQISFEQMKQVGQDLNNDFLNKGYWVKQGNFSYLSTNDCVALINALGSCLGFNPASPYGLVFIPRYPNDSNMETIFLPGSNLSDTFKLRGDEAIVIMGITPPKSKFTSYVPYLFTRNMKNQDPYTILKNIQFFTSAGFNFSEIQNIGNTFSGYIQPGRFPYLAALGHSIHDDIMNSSNRSNENFNGAFVIVFTADKNIYNSIINDMKNNIFPKYNINANIINQIQIPSDFVNLGFDNLSDDFQILNRLAYSQGEEGKEYLRDPKVVVYRIVPKKENKFSKKFKYSPTANKSTGISELQYNNSLNLLSQAVKIYYDKSTRIVNSTRSGVKATNYFIENCTYEGFSCLVDSPEASYIGSGRGNITESSDDFFLFVGLNHVKTNKASYQNFAFTNTYGMAYGSLNDGMFAGSTDRFVDIIKNMKNISEETRNELLNNIDKFFVYKISRVCNNESYCYQIPINTLICKNNVTNKVEYCNPPGVAGIDENNPYFMSLERAYDDPFGRLGPSCNEVLAPIGIRYIPRV